MVRPRHVIPNRLRAEPPEEHCPGVPHPRKHRLRLGQHQLQVLRRQRLGQRDRRRIDRLVRELERAVMMGERLRRPAIRERFHRVKRIHVLVLHEPARLIGADRQDREPQWTMRLGDAAEMSAIAVAGIADDVEFADGRFEDKTRPQRLVAIEQATRRPVPRRH